MQTPGMVRWLALGLLCAACVGGSKSTSEEDKQRLKAYVLAEPPKDLSRKLGIVFDDRVELIGYRLKPSEVLKPGKEVTLTLYWKSLKKVDAGWNLFTHVLDGSGERVLNIDNVGPIREWRDHGQVLGPAQWEPGKVYVDEQTFTVPASVKTSKVQIVAGLWRDADRMPIVKGPKDRENRGIVANLSTGDRPERVNTRVPSLRVDKLPAGMSITVDGKLDEEAWKQARSTGAFLDVTTGKRNTTFPVNASAKLTWDDKALYVAFEVKDPDVVGGFDAKSQDPHLWTRDTVEIMIDPDGNGDNKDYYEIQINPQNLVFDSQFDAYNQPKKDPDGPFGHQEWSAELKSAVTVNGTLDKSGDTDQGYVVEAQIPWKSFGKAKQSPPALGDTWRINLYAMQNNSGVAWSPILGQGNFHKASRFGRVLFAEKGFTPPLGRNRLGALDGGLPRRGLRPLTEAPGSAVKPGAQPAPVKPEAKPPAASPAPKPEAAPAAAKP